MTYENSESTSVSTTTGEIERLREQNMKLYARLTAMQKELGVLRYLESHIECYIEGISELDEGHIRVLFDSLQRIRGY